MGHGTHAIFGQRGWNAHILRRIRYGSGKKGQKLFVAVYQIDGKMVGVKLVFPGHHKGAAVHEKPVEAAVEQHMAQLVGAHQPPLHLVQRIVYKNYVTAFHIPLEAAQLFKPDVHDDTAKIIGYGEGIAGIIF